jgi:hypothetical protein
MIIINHLREMIIIFMGLKEIFTKFNYILSFAVIKTCPDSLNVITLKEIDRK